VPRGDKTWKVKLRATTKGKANLAAVQELLQQYRW
jgi:hypothetical protein